MLVSFKKNKWILEWMKDRWHDEVLNIFTETADKSLMTIYSPASVRKMATELLNKKGYKSRLVKDGSDIIIFIPDEEYTFLLLKYIQ